MKIGDRANVGDVAIKVEVAVQGDAQEFDVMSKVNCMESDTRKELQLVKSLKSIRGTNADGFCLVDVESQAIQLEVVTRTPPLSGIR